MKIKGKFHIWLLSFVCFFIAVSNCTEAKEISQQVSKTLIAVEHSSAPSTFENVKLISLKGILQASIKLNEGSVNSFPGCQKNKRDLFSELPVQSASTSSESATHYKQRRLASVASFRHYLFYSNLRI